MSDALDRVAAAVDGIERHITEIEEALAAVKDSDEWRTAIGLVHGGSTDLWKLRRQMLDEAMRQARDKRTPL
jgi:hypothetical protein